MGRFAWAHHAAFLLAARSPAIIDRLSPPALAPRQTPMVDTARSPTMDSLSCLLYLCSNSVWLRRRRNGVAVALSYLRPRKIIALVNIRRRFGGSLRGRLSAAHVYGC